MDPSSEERILDENGQLKQDEQEGDTPDDPFLEDDVKAGEPKLPMRKQDTDVNQDPAQ